MSTVKFQLMVEIWLRYSCYGNEITSSASFQAVERTCISMLFNLTIMRRLRWRQPLKMRITRQASSRRQKRTTLNEKIIVAFLKRLRQYYRIQIVSHINFVTSGKINVVKLELNPGKAFNSLASATPTNHPTIVHFVQNRPLTDFLMIYGQILIIKIPYHLMLLMVTPSMGTLPTSRLIKSSTQFC